MKSNKSKQKLQQKASYQNYLKTRFKRNSTFALSSQEEEFSCIFAFIILLPVHPLHLIYPLKQGGNLLDLFSNETGATIDYKDCRDLPYLHFVLSDCWWGHPLHHMFLCIPLCISWSRQIFSRYCLLKHLNFVLQNHFFQLLDYFHRNNLLMFL